MVKCIVLFVYETIVDEIWYTKDTSSSLVRYSDADQAVNFYDRKISIICCLHLRNNLISWYSKK